MFVSLWSNNLPSWQTTEASCLWLHEYLSIPLWGHSHTLSSLPVQFRSLMKMGHAPSVYTPWIAAAPNTKFWTSKLALEMLLIEKCVTNAWLVISKSYMLIIIPTFDVVFKRRDCQISRLYQIQSNISDRMQFDVSFTQYVWILWWDFCNCNWSTMHVLQ